MAMLVAIMITRVMMMVHYVGGDCNAGDGSDGHTVVMEKEHGDGDGTNGDCDVPGQGGHVDQDGGDGDENIAALLTPDLKRKWG